MGGHIFFVFFFFLLLLKLSFADDAAAMLKLSQSFTSTPVGWVGSNPCKWKGVSCDSSNKVTSINMISKSLSGKLPTDVFNQISSLQTLFLQQNRITGSLPSLSNLNNLKEVNFDGNQFTSFPTKFLSNLPSLQTVSLSNNPFSPWTLNGDSLSKLTALQVFRASSANIFGQIPDIFESVLSLTDLRLSYNNLTGPLPTSFTGSAIQNLWINDQKSGLSGALDVLGGMSSLSQAWLHNNAFVGMIPDLSKCTKLFDLQLRGNQLTGLVPATLMDLPKLVKISLQNNMLQGQVPVFKNGIEATIFPGNSFCNPKPGSCDPQVMVLLQIVGAVGYPMVLAQSWKGNDACDGWAHVTCDSTTKSVIGLNFVKQGFLGTISPMFTNLTSLTTLELSSNKLYGKIPVSLLSLNQLKLFDVSNNNLTGKVPDFRKSIMVKVNNNPFIGTNVDTTPGAGSKDRRSSASSKLSSLSPLFIVGIVVLLMTIIVASTFAIYFLFLNKKGFKFPLGRWVGNERENTPDARHKSSNGSPATSSAALYDGGSFIYSIEVLQEVTNYFSNENILGKGGFGVVYRGELQDGTQIAVKRMESDSLGTKGLSEFQAEIGVLSKVRHRHLVALLGFCVNGNERFIVYECMPRGTLAQNLFGWKELGSSPLTWMQRLVIALDVARGIEYLHSLAQESFIHRDLKPSNILLGSDMRAKVSDFGLVKNAPDGIHSVETRLAGTFGYLAPEYAETGRVTTKVDVYAYGVVLMEIITGRKALDQTLPDEEMQLATWFRRVIIEEDNMSRAIDSSMELDEDTYESIHKVAELAGHCTAREPLQRPDMGHAVSIISPLVSKWRPTECENGEASVSINSEMTLPQAMRKWQTGETSTMTDHSYSQSMINSSSLTYDLDIESQRPFKEKRERDD